MADTLARQFANVLIALALLNCFGCSNPARAPDAKHIELVLDAKVFEPLRLGEKLPDFDMVTFVEDAKRLEMTSPSSLQHVYFVRLPGERDVSALVDGSGIVNCLRVNYPKLRFGSLGTDSTYREILAIYPHADVQCQRGFATCVYVKPGVRFCFDSWTEPPKPEAVPMWIDFLKTH